MSQFSRTESFFVDLLGWTLTILAIPAGAAFVGLVLDGMLVTR